MLVAMMMLALAAPNAGALNAPRKAYQACLKMFETTSMTAKMDSTAYGTAVKAACTAEGASLARALTDYDVAMGTKRSSAAATAANDVADYMLTSQERFSDMVSPAKAK